MKKRRKKKLISAALKISLSALMIYLVLKEVDAKRLAELMKAADFKHFGLAFIFIAIAQVFGGLRMRYNLHTAEFNISHRYAVGMYFMGTLFNIVLPGGIGGDGYRAFYFHKRFRFPWQKTIMAILRGRASGLFFLFLFLILFAFFYRSHLQAIPFVDELLVLALVSIFPLYSICTKIFLREPVAIQIGGLKYSLMSQLFFLFAIVAILEALGSPNNMVGYIMVFLVANIVAVIPISFGGVGLREFTYVKLAGFMALNSDIGVTASFTYYLIYTAVAFLGFIPYAMLRKMDYHELLYQRKINQQKFTIDETRLKDEEVEHLAHQHN